MTTEGRGAAMVRLNSLRWALLVGYMCLIVYGTLYPFAQWRVPDDFPWMFHAALRHGISRTDILANVLLYVPLGFLAAVGRRWRALPWVLVAALVLSVCLEYMQGFLPDRVTSWLDVLTNVSGAGIGVAVAALAVKLWWGDAGAAWVRELMLRLRSDRVAWVGIAALIVWGCAQLIPFVPSLSLSNVKDGLKPVWYALQGSEPVSAWRCVVYFAATAALMVSGASALRITRWGGIAALFLLITLPLKVLMLGRQLSLEALIGTCSGVAVGLVLWNSSGWRALIVAALLVSVYWVAEALQPGATSAAMHAFNWIPLRLQLAHPLNGLANLADTVWPPLVLACLCRRLEMRSLWVLLPSVALLLFALECAQLWVPGRYPDITTVLVGTAAWVVAAGCVGGRVARQQ